MADGQPTHDDAFDRLRLIRSANVGPVTFVQLLRRFGSASAAIDALPDLARRGGGRAPRLADKASIEREVAAVRSAKAKYLFLGDPHYPALLAEIDNAPPVLTFRGDKSLLARPMVAIVGARNASAAACRFARELAGQLAERGHVVVSGLARGVDTAAHTGALSGHTVGVIASGIDIAYPPENAPLQERIASDNLLLAEQPPGTEPLARHFPFRNRIIAGLTGGTIVVEAAPRSGSLITARLAGEFGREVMAVPGSPLDPRAQGCNGLIRDGATLIQSADDVIESIGPIDPRAAQGRGLPYEVPPVALDAGEDERQAITNLLSPTPVAVDEIVRQSGRDPASVHIVLLELELAGRLERHAGGKVSFTG